MLREGSIQAPDGRTLVYLERGDPDGPAVVFNHGTPGCRLSRHPDESVYQGIRAISYDRPGYGRSDPSPGRDVASAAADVAAIADALGLGRFGIFGVSGGGPHALACAALLPDRVTKAAVLVGAAPADDPEFDFLAGMTELNLKELGAALTSPEALATELAPFVEMLATDPEAELDHIAAELPESDREMLARPGVREAVSTAMHEAVAQGDRGWADDDLAFVKPWGFQLEDVACEVRLWQGDLDVLVPRAHGEYLERRLPNATFELVTGEGHFIYGHWPAALAWLAAG